MPTKPHKRLLIIKPKRIGDTLLLTPTIFALQQIRPKIEVHVLAYEQSARILRDFGLKHIWTVSGTYPDQKLTDRDLLRVSFDWAIELSGQPYATKVLLECKCPSSMRFYSRLYEISENKERNQKRLSGGSAKLVEDRSWKNRHAILRDWFVVRKALRIQSRRNMQLSYPLSASSSQKNGKRVAILQPFTSEKSTARRWPTNRWRVLARALLGQGKIEQVVIPYAPSTLEGPYAQEIASGIENCDAQPMLFSELAAAVKRASICVTCNSAPMHIAAAVRSTPIVAIWGDGDSPIDVWYPWCKTFSIVCQNEIFDSDQVRKGRVPYARQEGPIIMNTVERVLDAIKLLGLRS